MRTLSRTTLALMFCALAALLLWLPPVADLERWSIDQRFIWRGPRAPSTDLRIIGIDDASVRAAERPGYLWNPLYAEFLKGVGQASASTVLLDLVFKAGSDLALREFIGRFFADRGIVIPPPVLRQFSLDQPLREAVLATGKLGLRIVLGYTWEKGQPVTIEDALLRSVPFGQVGFFNVSTDPDHTIRSAVLYGHEPQSGRFLPSIDLVVASLTRPGLFTLEGGTTPRADGKPLSPGSDAREALIDFAGPAGTIPIESFKDVLADIREHPERLARFAGKTLLVGVIEIADVKMTAAGLMSGIELHGNIIENLIGRRFLRQPPGWLEPFLLIALLTLMTTAWGNSLRSGLALTLLGCPVWFFTVTHAFSSGTLLPLSRPILLLIAGSALAALWMYRRAEEGRRKVRELFGRYVNDSIVSSLLQQSPEAFLGGTRRQVCVMFSDIRGFTTFSENRSPDQVVQFLNRYFEGLTEIILSHDGVVDKFLGDGLMAFFNAPLDTPEYPVRAADAALAMREFVKREEIRRLVDPFELKIGIALHEGPALVGNIGSMRKTEFTAIGDTVNTASRLESLNKEFGTDIIASEQLVRMTGQAFEWRFLEERPIRGREQTIRLYALIGRKLVDPAAGRGEHT
ncbi:MAG TPA: adenylate/guanylate cyclase domain-containing protein [Candidatus Ozemobacteraceae bacterium]